MNIFEILGPVMVGPSSSHTAGAVRIGWVTRILLGSQPVQAKVGLHGSFAATGQGHGTDKAIIAGLLGMQPDDVRIPDSFRIAKEQKMEYSIGHTQIAGAHPNTALLNVVDKKGRTLEIQASSVGGGRIMLNKIDGVTVNCNADSPTLIVHNYDKPGHVAEVTSLLAKLPINIATLQLHRIKRGGKAVMVVEVDQPLPDSVVETIEQMNGIIKVTYINVGQKAGETDGI